jgi:hypothetical protein
VSIRTTLTLDEDLYDRLKRDSRSQGVSFRDTVNRVLRAGLHPPPARRKKFKVKAKNMGVIPGLNYDCTSKLLDELEGPAHR